MSHSEEKNDSLPPPPKENPEPLHSLPVTEKSFMETDYKSRKLFRQNLLTSLTKNSIKKEGKGRKNPKNKDEQI